MKTLLLNLVNKIKINIKHIAIIALIVFLGLFGWKGCRKVAKTQDKQATSTVLAPNQKEKIIVNPEKKEVEVITKNANGTTTTTTTYLPDRPTTIIEDNNGKLSLIDHTYGAELRPYMGIGGSLDGTARVHAGADFFYFHRLDLGAGLDFNAGVFKTVSSFDDTRISANISYNYWSNSSLALSIDNRKFVGLFIKVRL